MTGDEPEPALGEDAEAHIAFFRRADTQDAIRTLAAAESITVIVGAGSSGEVGFPLWEELIIRLLRVTTSGMAEEDQDGLCEAVLKREGPLGAATIVRARLEDDDAFITEMREQLYSDVPDEVRPGATAEGVARLFWGWPDRDCYVLTTNYDLMLEQALLASEHARTRDEVHRVMNDQEPRLPSIYYLHGYISREDSQDVVLSERDYLGQQHNAWQETLIRRRFQDSHCLFVGSSLADPNLLGYLIRNPHMAERVFAIFVRPNPSDVEPDIPTDRSGQEIAAEQLARSRWEQLGVTVLYADYESQPSQFLHEVAYAKERSDAGLPYQPYGDRLDQWFEHTQRNTLGLVDQDEFELVQDQLHETAAEWVHGILQLLHENGLVPEERGEFVAAQLWSRIPQWRSMAMTVCSDRSWRRSKAVDLRRIMLPTQRTAIEAFCYGRERVFDREDGKRHWNFVQAWPVAISGPEWGRLPVGSVALVSTRPREESVFTELDPVAADGMRSFLVASAADLLDPGSTAGVDPSEEDADDAETSE